LNLRCNVVLGGFHPSGGVLETSGLLSLDLCFLVNLAALHVGYDIHFSSVLGLGVSIAGVGSLWG